MKEFNSFHVIKKLKITDTKPTVIMSCRVNLNHILVSFNALFVLFQIYPTLHRAF